MRASFPTARRFGRAIVTVSIAALTLALAQVSTVAPATAAGSQGVAPNAVGMLDCNGLSPIQKPVKINGICTDPRSSYDGVPSRFYDNGSYIGHDEPSLRFLSTLPGSANDVTWNEALPRDPVTAPTVATPGSDVTHWFELSVAPWFGMAICDSHSYPLTACTPQSDANAPQTPSLSDGGGSAFLEVQFYPPGFAPFVDSISCDNTHWCAALTIDSLECSLNFVSCNGNCIEPVNFAYIQNNGVPAGPPSPQLANLATFTPNKHTLMMNPGDNLSVHIFDANGPGGRALKVTVDDSTTGQSGSMQASAANGFMATNFSDCSGVPFNFEPEYNTAQPQNLVPWAALQGGILTQFEIGHFTPCTSVTNPVTVTIFGFTDTVWQTCNGPYEVKPDKKPNPEQSDMPCYPVGDTHGGTVPPNLVTGCVNSFVQNGDIDFDGTPYWPDWPNSTAPDTFPSTFKQAPPTTNGSAYAGVQFETDVGASESTCSAKKLSGCAVPPPGSPGNFYPYWTQASASGQCVWEFGQMQNGNAFGGSAQYDGPSAYFFGTLSSAVIPNPTC
ncbi:MAG TPA: hypothetical protein VF792_07725 [Ktedonobacterales bacterium]